jgi:B12-binding domain/radical SAM domain protein
MPSKDSAAVVFYITRQNRYSFNAIIGASEEILKSNKIKPYFITDRIELLTELREIQQVYSKAILCISFFTAQVWETESLIKEVRNLCRDRVIIVAGGPHPTGAPEQVLSMGADIVVRGEGEETIVFLLRTLADNLLIYGIRGISYCREGEYIFTGWASPVDIEKVSPFSFRFGFVGPLEITRGCPFKCHYCQTPYLFRGPVRHRSIDTILKYISLLKKRGLRDFRFISPNALSYGSLDGRSMNFQAIEELLSRMRRILGEKRRIFFGTFPSEVRPEHLTEEALEIIIRYCDNRNIVIGAQSGSQRVLDLCRRGHTVEDVVRAVELTKKFGLVANVDFIFGLPGETEEDQKLTAKLMEELASKGAKIHAHTFMPLPQTPFRGSSAVPITDTLKKTINKLLPVGKLYGNWMKQQEISKRLESNFIEKG